LPQRHEGTKKNDIMDFQPLSQREELIGKAIVNAAYKVHHALGPGLLERVYEVCLAHELQKNGFEVKRIYL